MTRMPRHPDTVTVGVTMGAHLLRRLDAVASDLGMDRPEALHTALLHWLEEEERKTAVRNRMLSVRAWPKTDVHAPREDIDGQPFQFFNLRR